MLVYLKGSHGIAMAHELEIWLLLVFFDDDVIEHVWFESEICSSMDEAN